MTINCNPYNYKTSGIYSGYNLFDIKISDHILTGEEAKGFALSGTYTLTADTAAYAKALKQKEAGSEQIITVGDYSFTGYVHPNGHIFYDISEKPAVDSIYEATGIAYYFGIDTENQRIFLPRLKHVTLGMGNLTDTIRAKGNGKTLGWFDGETTVGTAMLQNVGVDGTTPTQAGAPVGDTIITTFPASMHNKLIGVSPNPINSGIVVDGKTIEDAMQPAYLYFCVGNTLVNTANIDVEKLTGDLRNLEAKINISKTDYIVYETDWFNIAPSGAYAFDLTNEPILSIPYNKWNLKMIAKVKTAQNGYNIGDIVFPQYANIVGNTGNQEQGSTYTLRNDTLLIGFGQSSDFIGTSPLGGYSAISKINVQVKIIIKGWKL